MLRAQSRSSKNFTPWVTIAAMAFLAATISAQSTPGQSAQQQPAQQQSQQPSQQASSNATVNSSEVSDPELEQFTKSLNSVMDINQQLQSDLAANQDEAKTQQLRQQANEKMAAAIRSNGMTVERFNEISRSLKTDPELNQRVVTERGHLSSTGQPGASSGTSNTPNTGDAGSSSRPGSSNPNPGSSSRNSGSGSGSTTSPGGGASAGGSR
jgi:PBP1b-binding outer membrane lipoprotein LpoB